MIYLSLVLVTAGFVGPVSTFSVAVSLDVVFVTVVVSVSVLFVIVTVDTHGSYSIH